MLLFFVFLAAHMAYGILVPSGSTVLTTNHQGSPSNTILNGYGLPKFWPPDKMKINGRLHFTCIALHYPSVSIAFHKKKCSLLMSDGTITWIIDNTVNSPHPTPKFNLPCHRAQWLSDKQLHHFQTENLQFYPHQAALRWLISDSSNVFGTSKKEKKKAFK